MTTTVLRPLRRALAAAAALSMLALAGCAVPGTPPTFPTELTFLPSEPTGAGQPSAEGGASSAIDVVTAPVPIDPVRPDVPLNLDDRVAQADLWARLRRGFAMPDLDNDLVHDREQWYMARPDYVSRMTERGSRYMFYIVEELDHRGMPTELALLPFIESAFNPQAMSTAKASGMWQFIPSTGKDFALKQNVFRDDRRDVLASTRAALDYLQKLYGMFGDWHLALAAYNWGEGSVTRAIARNEKLGLPTDYASLKMPSETQYYVPKLQAVKNIVSRPADFNLALHPVANHPYFLSVPLDHDLDVALAAKLADLSPEAFRELNPQMNKPVILAAGTPQVLLPYDNAERFVRALPRHRGPLASWTAWVTPRTMKPSEVAREAGMDEADLRAVNHIPPRMLIKAGSTLLIPRIENRHADVTGDVADNATMALAPDLPPLLKRSLKAGRHDSVATIAARYRLNAAQVAQWNHVGNAALFKPGQTVVVYTAKAPVVTQAPVATKAPVIAKATVTTKAAVIANAAVAAKATHVATAPRRSTVKAAIRPAAAAVAPAAVKDRVRVAKS